VFDKHLPNITHFTTVSYKDLGRCWHFLSKIPCKTGIEKEKWAVFDVLPPEFDSISPALDSILPAFDSISPALDSISPAFDSISPAFDSKTLHVQACG
jgi:hypothetical protein